MRRIEIIDSHTEGEPTRVVVAGGPDLGTIPVEERLATLRREHDGLRQVVLREPRGSDILVGALLAPAVDPEAVAQVIFFNNVGYLGMCVHGTLGVARTLRHLGRVERGTHRLETPAGPVAFTLDDDGGIAVENVPSYRHAHGVEVETTHHGKVRGDVAYGGNWFFLVSDHGLEIGLDHVEALTDFAWDVRRSLEAQSITGAEGALIDHVELFTGPSRPDADSKNFVLCPGKAYDRSPCGTGTSAKMACLAADGVLSEGQVWRQESTVGSLFEGTIRRQGGSVVPTVRGRAFITAEATLLVEADDPYPLGVGP